MTVTQRRQDLTDLSNRFPAYTQSGWAPSDYGWIDWTYDPAQISAGLALSTAGLLFLLAIPIRVACTISNVGTFVTSAGATLTSGQCFAALYQNGNRLAVTASQHTAWQSTGLKTMALTVPQPVTAGIVQIGLYYNGTTAPSVAYPISGGGTDFFNLNSVQRIGYDSTHTGNTTTSPPTLGTFTPYTVPFFGFVS